MSNKRKRNSDYNFESINKDEITEPNNSKELYKKIRVSIAIPDSIMCTTEDMTLKS
jgi:hypothetical protein